MDMYCRGKGLLRFIISIMAVWCVVSGSALAQSRSAGPPAVPVVVAQTEARDLAPVAWVAGSVVSRNEAEVSAEVAGRLTWVAEEGARLAKGDVLARMDDILLKLEVTEAEAQVAQHQSRLKFLRPEVERLQRLARTNNAAQTQLEQTEADRDATINELEGAQARVALARERLSRTVIRSPFTGIIVARRKRSGEWVSPGDAVGRLVDTANREVEATAPLHLQPYLKKGQTLDVRTADETVPARLRAIVGVGEDVSRLMALKLDFDHDAWLVGQPVELAIPTALVRTVLTVPRDALVLRRDGASVFRINGNNAAERVAVTLGVAAGDYIEVIGKLQPGDQIVTRGNERLRPGQTVNIVTGEQ